jgi:hypothetical protein
MIYPGRVLLHEELLAYRLDSENGAPEKVPFTRPSAPEFGDGLPASDGARSYVPYEA